MAVNSSSFSSVTLTEEDAKKFKRQITFGKPKAAANASVSRGVELADQFRSSGRTLTIKVPGKAR